MTTERADIALERLLDAIERELVEATDEDVLAAAGELGIRLDMNRGSAAFVGITRFARPRAGSVLAERTEPRKVGRKAPRRAPRRPKGDAPSS